MKNEAYNTDMLYNCIIDLYFNCACVLFSMAYVCAFLVSLGVNGANGVGPGPYVLSAQDPYTVGIQLAGQNTDKHTFILGNRPE